MNMNVTNVDLGSILLEGQAHTMRDSLLTFAGAGTVLAGTILARDSVSGNLIPYVVGGATNEDGIAKTVLTYDVTAEAAGDVPVRVPQECTVREEHLIVAADVTADATTITAAQVDELRVYGIKVVSVEDLSVLDNQ